MYNLHITAERIKELCDKRNISINKMLTESGAGARTYHNILSGSHPSADKITKIAEYLDCSVDYLLGRQNFSVPHDIEKKNNAIANIVLRLRSDAELLSIVEDLSALPSDKLQAVKTLISVIKE